jgi:hypothetical protein
VSPEELAAQEAAALARLETREDPAPAPELPPIPEVVICDMRLRITQKDRNRHVALTDGEGNKLPAENLLTLACEAAQIMLSMPGLPPPLAKSMVAMLKARARMLQDGERQRVSQAMAGHDAKCAIVAWAGLRPINGSRGSPPPCTCGKAGAQRS